MAPSNKCKLGNGAIQWCRYWALLAPHMVAHSGAVRQLASMHCQICSLYPFNCQFVVKWQQNKNHSNLGILGSWSCIIHQMHPIDRSWLCEKCGKGCICARGKKKTFTKGCDQCYCVYWVRVGCNVMPVCLTCHCLVACIGHPSDSPYVSRNHLWLPVDFQRIQHRHWSQPPPVLQKLQNLEASMTERTELAHGDG